MGWRSEYFRAMARMARHAREAEAEATSQLRQAYAMAVRWEAEKGLVIDGTVNDEQTLTIDPPHPHRDTAVSGE